MILAPLVLAWLVQESHGRDLTELSIEDLLEIPIQTVFGASKLEQRTTEAPSSVTIVTAQEIRDHGYRTLADVLRGVRGIFVTNDRNYEHIGLRGFNPLGDYNGRVLLLVDGHRINDIVYGSASIGLDFPLDVALIERVEIIRGPGSSLYGSNAFFGVIDVRTKGPSALQGTEASAGAGSFDAFDGRLSHGSVLPGGAELVLSGTLFDSAGQRLFYEEYAGDPSGGFTDGTDDESGYSVFSSLSAGAWRIQGALVSREKGIPTGAFGTVFDDPDNRTLDQRTYLDVSYRREIPGRWDLAARIFYDAYDYRGTYIYDATASGGPPDLENRDFAWGRWWGAEAHGTLLSVARHRITLGVELRDDLRKDQRNYDATASYLDDRREGALVGVFAQDEYQLAERWRLEVGARYDHHDTFGGTANPRVALVYNPDDASACKLLYGRAFRAPNAYESFYDDGYSAKANPDLEPETIQTFEGVYERTWQGGWRLAASLYHYEIRDLIVQVTDPMDGLLVFQNADSVEANGIEVELEHRFANGARVQVSHALQRAEIESTGERLTNSPDHLFQLLAEAPLRGPWRAGIDLQALSDRDTLSGGDVPGYVVANLTLRAPELVTGLDLELSVTNLLDAEIRDPGGPEHLQDEILQDGRAIWVRLTWRP